MNKINDITRKLMDKLSVFQNGFKGAFSLRENGVCTALQSSDHVVIQSKLDKPGIDVYIEDGTQDETVYVPSCVTHGGIDDLVSNDYHVGKNWNITIISGCGVETDNEQEARHNGIHNFDVGENSHVKYVERHIGDGQGTGTRSLNPVTMINLHPYSSLEIDSAQIGGVDKAFRSTTAQVDTGAKLIIQERLYTDRQQDIKTHFKVELNGEGSSADVVSRSVARDQSRQVMDSVIIANAPCTGHSECDSLIGEEAIVDASPRLFAHNKDASLVHEAAVGRIAGEQILKLRTLGLTEEQAEDEIVNGFLS